MSSEEVKVSDLNNQNTFTLENKAMEKVARNYVDYLMHKEVINALEKIDKKLYVIIKKLDKPETSPQTEQDEQPVYAEDMGYEEWQELYYQKQ